jgi:hypothetical protein
VGGDETPLACACAPLERVGSPRAPRCVPMNAATVVASAIPVRFIPASSHFGELALHLRALDVEEADERDIIGRRGREPASQRYQRARQATGARAGEYEVRGTLEGATMRFEAHDRARRVVVRGAALVCGTNSCSPPPPVRLHSAMMKLSHSERCGRRIEHARRAQPR